MATVIRRRLRTLAAAPAITLPALFAKLGLSTGAISSALPINVSGQVSRRQAGRLGPFEANADEAFGELPQKSLWYENAL